jgi:UDP-N-acetyl-D-glucosamine dehydrogenase
MIQPTAGLDLARTIQMGQARIAIIGLGYVGLPLATAFAEAGHPVVGLDLDDRKVIAVAEGVSYVDDINGDTFARQVESGRLSATTDPAVLAEVDVAIICVPTPCTRNKQPDLTCIYQAASMLVEHLHPEMLVVLESTTYPGTTQEVLRPLLEGRGLVCGHDFELAYSPERVDPGNKRFTLGNTPKIVAGVTPRARDLAAADCVVILTDHSRVPYDAVIRSARIVVDTRNVLRNTDTTRVIRL